MLSPPDRFPSDRNGALFDRVLMIGLDGATWDVLNPLMSDGAMPNLAALVAGGTSGVLESTRPPITPAAWTTFMTGKGPGKHGIIDFLRYDPATNRLTFNNNQKISQKTIWQILSEKSYRVGSINVPMTFPPENVNGFMISGFDTPSGQDFTHPKDLQAEILANHPDYTHEKKWERKALGGDKVFAQNLEYICQSFERGYELARFCGGKYGWDVLMVLFKLVDNLQHKAWRYLDPRTKDSSPYRERLTRDCFAKLDVVLGKLRSFADKEGATILVMSDHGHGSLDGKAQPNLLLSEWGYLSLRNNLARAKTRGTVLWRRLTRAKNGSPAGQLNELDHDLAVDWSQTRACVLHAGIYGFLYINLKGRQPQGIVDPADFESLRDEIRQRLLAAQCRDRDGRKMQIFTDVFLSEELYGCSRFDYPWMPDLLLAPSDGLAVVKKIRGKEPVRWVPLDRLEGTHRLDGIFIANGPSIAVGKKIQAHIADIAPTLLAGLGERVPKDMDGRVLTRIFEQPVKVEYEPPQERKVEELEPTLTQRQMQEVATRLGDLGYLD
ncbi:MAG TPA: alkaline phosphatase family protein [Phycisphaerae bacterium]|nr:alkaline phosphatase family protein [Phycisphaerae bacterium]